MLPWLTHSVSLAELQSIKRFREAWWATLALLLVMLMPRLYDGRQVQVHRPWRLPARR